MLKGPMKVMMMVKAMIKMANPPNRLPVNPEDPVDRVALVALEAPEIRMTTENPTKTILLPED